MDGNDLYRDMNEEEIIKSIILPVLSDLDQNGKNVIREHYCEMGRIDILLKNNDVPKVVVVEAKNGNQNLEDHKEQLLNYVKDMKFFDSSNSSYLFQQFLLFISP